jgi:hypothetical protein
MLMQKISSFVAGVLCLASCVPVAAQTTGSARPFHGALFGGQESQNSTQKLDVSALVLEAYDDNQSATLGSTVDPRSRQVGAFYTMLQPGIDYRLTHGRAQVGVTGASALGYYPDFRELRIISHTFGAGVSLRASRRTTVLLNQTTAYSPSYLSALFPSSSEVSPGDPIKDAPNYAVNDLESYSYGTTATVSLGLSRRTSVLIGGNYRYTDFTHETAVQRDQTSQSVDGQVSYKQSRNVNIRLGYHYLTGNLGYGPSASTGEHGLGGGVSYSRPLSATRRATFSFNLASSTVSTTGASPELHQPDRLYRASGDADFDYEFALSWRARGTYRRGIEFVPGLAQPVFTNGVAAELEGLLNRRVEFALSAGYSQGRSAISTTASQFDTYNGVVRLQYALTNSTAVHVEYLYYFYDFLGAVPLVSGASPRMERNGVRIGVRLLIPALRG